MNRRNLILFVGIAFILALLALGIAVFLFFFSGNVGTSSTQGGDGSGGFGSTGQNGNTGILGGNTNSNQQSTSTQSGNGGQQGTAEEKPVPVFRDLSGTPVAGYTIYETPTSTTIRYMERGTGHVFDTYPDKEEKIRLSQLTIPKVYDAYWFGGKKDMVLMRLLDERNGAVETFEAALQKKPTTTPGLDRPTISGESPYTLSGKFLSVNIPDVTLLDQDGSAYLYSINSNTASGIYSNLNTSRKAIIPGVEWQLQWVDANSIYITSNASALFPGYLFLIEKNGLLRRVLGDKFGLTTSVSPDKKSVIYSESKDNDFSFNVLSVEKNVSEPLPVKTFPEKCVWSSSTILYCGVPSLVYRGAYPDLWYKGQIRFHDTIYRIDTSTLGRSEVASYSVLQVPLDAVKLMMTKDGSFLTFVDKIEGHLWGLVLSN